MWVDKSPNQRASRVAIAGSIYMRRASLDVFKPKEITNQNENVVRNPSYGKIVKNSSRRTNNQIGEYSRKLQSPLIDKRNIIPPALGFQYSRKTPTPSFGHFDDYQASKVKAIQEKYKAMLSDYEVKKKSINSQLASLKASSSSIKVNIKEKDRGIGQMKSHRGHQNLLKQYETKSKQLIISKLTTGSKLTTKKKQKAVNLYPAFFKALKAQLLLEEQLRGIKTTINPQRKPQIQKIISDTQEGKYLKLLQLNPQQFDPFQTKKCSELSPMAQSTKLIQKYKECQQNWNDSVCCLNRKEARQIFEYLNFQKNQQITLKSFVREMSFLLEKHLRNRDLFRIYGRLTPLTQNNFCQVTSKKD